MILFLLSLAALALCDCFYYLDELSFLVLSNVATISIPAPASPDCIPSKVQYEGDPTIIGTFEDPQTVDSKLVFVAPADASRAHLFNKFTMVTPSGNYSVVADRLTKGQWCFVSANVRAAQIGDKVYVYLQSYECEDRLTDISFSINGAAVEMTNSEHITSNGYAVTESPVSGTISKIHVNAKYWALTIDQDFDVEQFSDLAAVKARHCFRENNVKLWEFPQSKGMFVGSSIGMTYVDTSDCIQFLEDGATFMPNSDVGEYANLQLSFSREGFSGGPAGSDPSSLPKTVKVAAIYPGYPDSQTTISTSITLDSSCQKRGNLEAVMLDSLLGIHTATDNCCPIGLAGAQFYVTCTGQSFCVDGGNFAYFYNSYGVRQWELNVTDGVTIDSVTYYYTGSSGEEDQVDLTPRKITGNCFANPVGFEAVYVPPEKKFYMTVYTEESCTVKDTSLFASVDGAFYNLTSQKRSAPVKALEGVDVNALPVTDIQFAAEPPSKNGIQYVIDLDTKPTTVSFLVPIDGLAKTFTGTEITESNHAPGAPDLPETPGGGLSGGAIAGIVIAVVVVVAVVIFLCVWFLVCKKRGAKNTAVA